jgi:hypothetical protein
MTQTLIGNTYGRLKVRQFSHSEKNKRYWLCDCDCSNETGQNKLVLAREDKLVSGRKKSCGCLRAELNLKRHLEKLDRLAERQKQVDFKLRTLRTTIKKSNSFRTGSIGYKHRLLKSVLIEKHTPKTDLLWHINFYEQLLKDGCYYCKAELEPEGCSVDWIDSEVGMAYNAIAACQRCREIRHIHNLTFDEMCLLSPALELIQIQRKLNDRHNK